MGTLPMAEARRLEGIPPCNTLASTIPAQNSLQTDRSELAFGQLQIGRRHARDTTKSSQIRLPDYYGKFVLFGVL